MSKRQEFKIVYQTDKIRVTQFRCPKCKLSADIIEYYTNRTYNFCPHCGTEMSEMIAERK